MAETELLLTGALPVMPELALQKLMILVGETKSGAQPLLIFVSATFKPGSGHPAEAMRGKHIYALQFGSFYLSDVS